MNVETLRLPNKLWLTLIGAILTGAASWYSLKADVSVHDTRITNADASIHAVEAEVKTTKEILIRVDENVKLLREEQRSRRLP